MARSSSDSAPLLGEHGGAQNARYGSSGDYLQVLKDNQGPGVLAVFVALIACCYYFFDDINRETSNQLFSMTSVQYEEQKGLVHDVHGNAFNYPLTLAFFQFAIMGIGFLVLWKVVTGGEKADLVEARLDDPRWSVLVGTHMFSTFWLQALMMPTQMMSLGLFAASRAIEIPAAAVMRNQVMGTPWGSRSALQAALCFGGAWLVCYSYTNIAECLCIWSGHGIALSGPPLFLIYFLVLTVPAAHAVCQESVLKQMNVHPLLLLALQNIFSCIVCFNFLILAHLTGWENVRSAMGMVVGSLQVRMLILWLAVQMGVVTGCFIVLTAILNSFWAIVIRSARVAFWWAKELFMFTIFSHTLLSVARPNASFWGLVMLFGVLLSSAAALVDPEEDAMEMEAFLGKRKSKEQSDV